MSKSFCFLYVHITGHMGERGAIGPRGIVGATGPRGIGGATGPRGIGATGPKGPAGGVNGNNYIIEPKCYDIYRVVITTTVSIQNNMRYCYA